MESISAGDWAGWRLGGWWVGIGVGIGIGIGWVGFFIVFFVVGGIGVLLLSLVIGLVSTKGGGRWAVGLQVEVGKHAVGSGGGRLGAGNI